ncbi:MAG: agenet domain-containing protein [Bacteroidota bacterium]
MKAILVFIAAMLISVQMSAQTYAVGDRLEALENDGLWYTVRILKYNEGRYLVHWEEYTDTLDQWLTVDRLRPVAIPKFYVGDHLEGLEVDGKWHPVTVLEISPEGKYKVHWQGYENSFDRWLEPAHLRYMSPSRTDTWMSLRVPIVYIENRTALPIKYNYLAEGVNGGGTIYPNQRDYIRYAPIGGILLINGKQHLTFTKEHNGQIIVIR